MVHQFIIANKISLEQIMNVRFLLSCDAFYSSRVTMTVGAGTGFNDKPDLHPSFYNTDWMAFLPDETPLSAIAIPGTHESLTLHGGPLTVCQVWTLKKQLRVGIRYLDVHAGIWFPTQKEIYIRDGIWMFWQHMDLGEVLKQISDFLKIHKNETVLLKLTLHGLYKSKVEDLVKTMIGKFQNTVWTKMSVPKIKQVRGKIVFLRSETFHSGADNEKSTLFESNKLKNVKEKMKQMKSRICAHQIVVTETAATALRSPKSLARRVNLQLSELIQKYKTLSLNPACLGVFSMDFPSAETISNML
uniref:Phosphatidylinositol-specific phospholipase C X domain-containing protein n=1 Tax=Oryzias latipes TaxID=8090 RepID=A0A3P9J217_ORYLA